MNRRYNSEGGISDFQSEVEVDRYADRQKGMEEQNKREYKGFTLLREAPYWMWAVYLDGKATPDFLAERYTEPSAAYQAIDIYLEKEKA